MKAKKLRLLIVFSALAFLLIGSVTFIVACLSV